MIIPTSHNKPSEVINALCFDIDDLAYSLTMKNGGRQPADYLVEKETYSLLAFLDSLHLQATMFVPGYVAQHFPALVKAMAHGGHDIASHGYRHIPAEGMQREDFRRDIVMSRDILENIASRRVFIYKDPCWGITPGTPWAYDELIDAGYTVDHSAQPPLLKSLGRGSDDMMPFRYKGLLTVIPVTFLRLFSRSIPFNGGLFCAYIPISRQINYYRSLNSKGIPFNYFCHPYEACPEGANRHFWKRNSITAGFYGIYFGKYRQYISKLAAHFRFGSLMDAYGGLIDPPAKDHVLSTETARSALGY